MLHFVRVKSENLGYFKYMLFKTCIRNLDMGNGVRTSNSSESAEVLANAFSSVFVQEPQGPMPELKYSNNIYMNLK